MRLPVYRRKERASAFNPDNVTVYYDHIYDDAKYEVKSASEVKDI